MWIIALLIVCSGLTFKSSAQDPNFDSQTVSESPQINKDDEWDHQTTGPVVTLSIERGHSGIVQGPLNEIPERPLVYSNQWRPLLMPIDFNPYGDRNLHGTQRDDSDEQQFMPTVLHRPDSSELNWTEYRYPVDTVNPQYAIRLSNPPPQLSRSVPRQFPSVPIPIRPPIMYPNALSINVRRSYTTNTRENQNSSDSIQRDSVVSDPVTSSYEERYTQVLPSPAFPNIPFIPQPPFPTFPYGNLRNAHGYFPQTPPLMFTHYRIPASVSRDSIPPLNTERENVPQYDREAGSEIEEETRPVQERPVFQQPSVVVDQSIEDTQRRVPNFTPRTPFSLPYGTPNFGVWTPAMFPPVVPNPIPGRIPPLQPTLLPEVPAISQEKPSVSEPVHVDDRRPLSPSPEAPPAVEESSLIDNLHDETGISEKRPNTLRIPYEFGYDMNDGKGTDQHRKEESDASGIVRGSYGYRDMFGMYRLVNYIADKNGFRAYIKSNEPGVASSGSADVVVVADSPQPDAVPKDLIAAEPESVDVPDLIAEGSGTAEN